MLAQLSRLVINYIGSSFLRQHIAGLSIQLRPFYISNVFLGHFRLRLMAG